MSQVSQTVFAFNFPTKFLNEATYLKTRGFQIPRGRLMPHHPELQHDQMPLTHADVDCMMHYLGALGNNPNNGCEGDMTDHFRGKVTDNEN